MLVNGQADILHDTPVERSLTNMAGQLSLCTRLIQEEIKAARRNVAGRDAHREWIAEAWLSRRLYQQEVRRLRLLVAEQRMQYMLIGRTGI
jgi:hypothetical protein